MNKNLRIVGLMIPFLIVLLLTPTAAGLYGPDFNNAVEITAGKTNDYFKDGDNFGYYKISCTSTTWMDIYFNCTYSNLMTLTIYDPNLNYITSNTYTGSGFYARITMTCSQDGYYYLKVNRSGTSGTLNFTISIELEERGSDIPGFELIFIFIGTILAISTMVLKIYPKSKRENIFLNKN